MSLFIAHVIVDSRGNLDFYWIENDLTIKVKEYLVTALFKCEDFINPTPEMIPQGEQRARYCGDDRMHWMFNDMLD